MKTTITIFLTVAFALASTNCTTTYDAYGNPRQSVDPGTAVAGAAAVGILGYALANKRSNNNRQGYYSRGNRGYQGHRGHYHRY